MKQYPSRMGVGASSILLILVIVSLTLFASVSLIQARADASLTQKTAVSTAAYYEADAQAQQTLALIDDALMQSKSPETVEGVLVQADRTVERQAVPCAGLLFRGGADPHVVGKLAGNPFQHVEAGGVDAVVVGEEDAHQLAGTSRSRPPSHGRRASGRVTEPSSSW